MANEGEKGGVETAGTGYMVKMLEISAKNVRYIF